MSLWDFELLLIDWVLHFEVDFVLEVLGQAQIVFVNAESILVFAQNIQVSLLELLWNLQVASSLDLLSGQSLPLHFWKAVVDVLAY
jgi:hypothetical protein